jgi:hypothetical protein
MLAGVAGVITAVVAVGPGAPVRGAAQVCVPVPQVVTCPPAPGTTSATASPPKTQPPPSSGHPTPTSSSTGRATAHPQPSSSDPGAPAYVPPGGTPLPTLPPPSPGSPPEPPELAVQTINLQIASAPPDHAGATVLLQATLEAQRGADTYAVPHASVVFTIISETGSGAEVTPQTADSGDTGVVVVTVTTGDKPGDTVVHAIAGAATADLRVHVDAQTVGPAKPTTKPVPAPPVSNSSARPWLVAGLAGLIVALISGYAAALALGRLPSPLQRRRVWGRRSR